MTSTVTVPLVLPVGQFFGSFHYTVGSPERTHNVRIHAEIRALDEPRFAVWALLHGVPDRLEQQPWTRDAVRAAGRGAEVDPILDALIAEGLCAEVAPGTDAAVEFARRHRMGHRMLGLGNTPEEPWLFAIGFFDQPVVRVTREVYDLWDRCERADSLWSVCEAQAELERGAGSADPAETDPARILHAFLGTIHHLLAMSVVYLEPRR